MLVPKILPLISPGETVETVKSTRSPSPRLKPLAIFSIGSIGVEKCCSFINVEQSLDPSPNGSGFHEPSAALRSG